MIYSKVLLSSKLIACDGHWKQEYLGKSAGIADRNSRQKRILNICPAIIVNQIKVISWIFLGPFFNRFWSVSLTFDLATCFWFRTHSLVIMIIFAKEFINRTMHDKVMGRTRTGFTEAYAQSLSADCDLHLWPSNMALVRDTSSRHDGHLCQIIFKSHHAWRSYGPDTIHTHTHTDKINSRCPSAISWRGITRMVIQGQLVESAVCFSDL